METICTAAETDFITGQKIRDCLLWVLKALTAMYALHEQASGYDLRL